LGPIVLPATGLLYADTCAIIYRVEGVEPAFSASAPLWDALENRTREACTSQLTLLEVLVRPLRENRFDLADLYRKTVLRTTGLACLPIDLRVLDTAARVRADHGLKTPDAIHAATALLNECTLFLTNDAVFRRVAGLPVVLLSEVAGT
jgi:predicted nucleic acid-binding protein